MKHIADSIIYLSGFISTVFFVLCGISYSSNKTWFIWTLFGGLVFGLLTGFLIWQNEVWKNQESISAVTETDVEPSVSCHMEYPIKVENEKTYRNKRNPSIIIQNSGPIAASSLSATVEIYVYNTKENKITELIKTGFKGFDHTVSAKVLEPFSDIEHPTIGINGKDLIAVYSVNIIYYRKADMKSFRLDEYFFTYNKRIYSDFEFRNDDDRYQKIIDEIMSFKPPNSKGNDVKFTAATEHTWFMESGPSILKRKNEDGSVTIAGTPIIQNDSKIPGLPHLIVNPIQFEESGRFIEAEIEGEHINAKVKYEVKNIGSVTAVITEDGFNPVVEIEPGQKKIYIHVLEIARGPGNVAPLQEFLDLLDSEQKFGKIILNLLYRPKDNDSKLFKATSINEFSKFSVR
ncbi:MAG: hypothetical protein K9N21_13685 [Deltaproteobacteria bacterium]|nr:hypothetical protein [Deltaproteobacteria bacterium]